MDAGAADPVAEAQAGMGRLMAMETNPCVRPVPADDQAAVAGVLATFRSRGTQTAAVVAEKVGLPEKQVEQLLSVLFNADELHMKVVDGHWAYGRVRKSSRGKGGVR